MSVAAGTPICQRGSFGRGVASGWFATAEGGPVLLTVAHLLEPAPLRQGPRSDCTAAVLDVTGASIHLCRAPEGPPVAQVIASGRFDKFHRVESRDAAIAVPAAGLVPGRQSFTAAGHAGKGRLVRTLSGRTGRVIETAWRSGHFGSPGDLLIESTGPTPLTVDGESGTLLLDDETGIAVGLVVGEVQELRLAGAHYPMLTCAHHLTDVMRLFGLAGPWHG
jgi:hypothetical protein